MGDNHLKRLSVPVTWDIKKKGRKFVARPFPGGHNKEYSVPLIVLFRDMLGKTKTVSELKYVLKNKNVLCNGTKLKEHKAQIGLMDAISIPEIKEHYRMVFDSRGKLAVIKIDEKEAALLPCKIKKKTKLAGGKLQLNFNNGMNMLVDKDDYKTGEVLMLENKAGKLSVKDHLKPEKGAFIYLTGGRHIGTSGKLDDIKKDKLLFRTDKKEVFETSLKYAFVIGKDKPAISLYEQNKD